MRLSTTHFDGFSVISYVSDLLSSMSYLICTAQNRIVIDPHEEDAMLEDLQGISQVTVILTHEHFDHISGVNWLKDRFSAVVWASTVSARRILSKRNGTELFPLLFLQDRAEYQRIRQTYCFPYRCPVDHCISQDTEWELDHHRLQLFSTPGHTNGSISVLLDGSVLFSGDALLGNGEELRSVDADPIVYQKVTLPLFQKLSKQDVIVFPGHGLPQKLKVMLDKEGVCHGA